LGSDASRIQKEEQRKIDDAQPLTEDEVVEKEKLLTQVKMFPVNSVYFNDLHHLDGCNFYIQARVYKFHFDTVE
jgi:hypothetical protein